MHGPPKQKVFVLNAAEERAEERKSGREFGRDSPFAPAKPSRSGPRL